MAPADDSSRLTEAAARRGVRSAAALEGALHVALRLARRHIAPFVTQLLAAREGELHLRAPVTEVELRRDEREAPLAYLPGQRIDLLSAQEQLAVAVRIVVRAVSLVVHGDMGTNEPRLAATDFRVRLLKRGAAVAERLHLRAGEHEPGLDAVEQVVVMPRPAV